jgi:hypothetical protein
MEPKKEEPKDFHYTNLNNPWINPALTPEDVNFLKDALFKAILQEMAYNMQQPEYNINESVEEELTDEETYPEALDMIMTAYHKYKI